MIKRSKTPHHGEIKAPINETALGSEESHTLRAGGAALSLLEALLLTLLEKNLVTVDEVDDMFEAAIAAHGEHVPDDHGDINAQIATLLKRLQTNGNSVKLRNQHKL